MCIVYRQQQNKWYYQRIVFAPFEATLYFSRYERASKRLRGTFFFAVDGTFICINIYILYVCIYLIKKRKKIKAYLGLSPENLRITEFWHKWVNLAGSVMMIKFITRNLIREIFRIVKQMLRKCTPSVRKVTLKMIQVFPHKFSVINQFFISFHCKGLSKHSFQNKWNGD